MTDDNAWPVASRRHYTLVCTGCGLRQDDDGLLLDCPADHPPALLRTEYAALAFQPRQDGSGLFRYQDWLPVVRAADGAGRTGVYRSARLARALGLRNLWIAFNGYWPERGAFLDTATFKELEAHTVLGRMAGHPVTLAVASSGNTGAAFAWACSQRRLPCVLVVPEQSLWRFQFPAALDLCVRLVSIEGDYPDAIALSSGLSRLSPFQLEGGIKNVGRRDGLGTVLLAAFETMHCLPTHYFQAVGSGTGAIAVHEAARRLRAQTASGQPLPRIMMCQNAPFTPIYTAWRANQRVLDDGATTRFRAAIKHVQADELTNWAPPYSIRGGVYDSLTESGGDVLAAGNDAVRAAVRMFLELEGMDIDPAAGVAVACLCRAAAEGRLSPDSVVLLNITGGGRRRASRERPRVAAQPQLRLSRDSVSRPDAVARIAMLCEPAPAPSLG